MKPRAVQRVNDRIRAERRLFRVAHDLRRCLCEPREIGFRVRRFRLAFREQHAHLHALFRRDTRHHKAVAAVIALSCDDQQTPERRNTPFELGIGRAARIFHHLYVQQTGLIRRSLALLHFCRRYRFRHVPRSLQRQIFAVDAGFLVILDRNEQALSALDDARADGSRALLRHMKLDVDTAARHPRHIVLIGFVRGVLRKLLLEHRNLLLERSSVRADSPFLDQTAVQHIMRRRRLLAEGMRVGLFDLLAHLFRYFRLCGKAGDRLRRQLDRRQALVLLTLRDHRADGALHLEERLVCLLLVLSECVNHNISERELILGGGALRDAAEHVFDELRVRRTACAHIVHHRVHIAAAVGERRIDKAEVRQADHPVAVARADAVFVLLVAERRLGQIDRQTAHSRYS